MERLSSECPRCGTPLEPTRSAGEPLASWTCPEHGSVTPLWRPSEPAYDSFTEHLEASRGFPSYVPWPLPPGWLISDFASVGAPDGTGAPEPRATLIAATGISQVDGPVEVLVITEETRVGLGARCAGMLTDDPGPELGEGAPSVRLRVEGQPVPLWSVTPTGSAMGVEELFGEWDRSVVVGEVGGRWLWLVVRPASAVLLLQDDWSLRDAATLGLSLVELPFGDPGTAW